MCANRSLCFILVLTLIGCTSQPKFAPFTGIPQSTAIHVKPFSGITDSEPPASKIGERAVEGGGMGAAAGAQVGFQMGMELTGDCGEFIIVCLGLMPVMGAVGLDGGVIVGSVVGLTEDLPYQGAEVEVMKQVISEHFEEEPPNQAFSEQFIDIASDSWLVNSSAENQVTVAVIGLRPQKEAGKTLAFEVTTAMTINYGSGDLLGTKPYQFTEITAAYRIDEWINGGRELYASEMKKVYANAATVFTALLKDPLL